MSTGGGGGMADLSSENNPDALEMVNDTAVDLDNVPEHVSALYMDNRCLAYQEMNVQSSWRNMGDNISVP